jgi:hypothetical protein
MNSDDNSSNSDDVSRRLGIPFNVARARPANDMPPGLLPASGSLRSSPSPQTFGATPQPQFSGQDAKTGAPK